MDEDTTATLAYGGTVTATDCINTWTSGDYITTTTTGTSVTAPSSTFYAPSSITISPDWITATTGSDVSDKIEEAVKECEDKYKEYVDKVDQHIDDLEEDIEFLDQQRMEHNTLIEELENNLIAAETKIGEQQKKIAELEAALVNYKGMTDWIEGRLEQIEKKIQATKEMEIDIPWG